MERLPFRRLAASLALFAASAAGLGWTYPEHRDITAEGIRRLDPRRRAALDALWAQAREGKELRLCESDAAGDQGPRPGCIDLAAFPAISADHSCSSKQLLDTILDSSWILDVAGATSRAGAGFAKAQRPDQLTNIRTRLDIALERADREYSSRAGANNAHFLVPRQGKDAREDAVASVRPGAPLNALALYILYHEAALRLADGFGSGADSKAERTEEARRILALEAFALHFLEDTFAAGHVVGSWGTVPERKGTHDYYNEHGLEATSWEGHSMILFGDGYIRPEDLTRTGVVVAQSLTHVLDALEPGSPGSSARAAAQLPAEVLSATFDVCSATVMPDWNIPPAAYSDFMDVLLAMPMPFRGPGAASLPRFRAEIGPFIALASGASVLGASGGFDGSDQKGRAYGSLDVGARLGIGLEGLLVDAGDGQLFIQGGFLMAAKEPSSCPDPCAGVPSGSQILPQTPARSGIAFRFRAPYWLLPGDLILAAPILAFTSPDTLKKMGMQAVDGGLIPWQTGLATPFGRFQFVAGREIGITMFGYLAKDSLLTKTGTGAGGAPVYTVVQIRSIQYDFPLVEYRPFRTFATGQSFAMNVQFGVGFDKPGRVEVIAPVGAAVPQLKTRYIGFLKIAFDGRQYF